MSREVEVRVKGGFPLLVEIAKAGRDYFGRPEYEVQSITTLAGKKADFITNRLSPKEWDDMIDTAIERAF